MRLWLRTFNKRYTVLVKTGDDNKLLIQCSTSYSMNRIHDRAWEVPRYHDIKRSASMRTLRLHSVMSSLQTNHDKELV